MNSAKQILGIKRISKNRKYWKKGHRLEGFLVALSGITCFRYIIPGIVSMIADLLEL